MNQTNFPSRRLPAEWEPQSGIMLTWPHRRSDWRNRLGAVEKVFLDIAREIAKRQRLIILAYDLPHQQQIEEKLVGAGVCTDNVKIYPVPSNDTWARDHGPIAIYHDHQFELLDFNFNGWGNKYPAKLDNAINRSLHELGAFGKTALSSKDFVLEGGSIDSNGRGVILTTENCLLATTRNPHLSQVNIETYLKAEFGASQLLWLSHGSIVGDDTDGHIDMLARFVGIDSIAYVSCEQKDDDHFATLDSMHQELAALRQPDGEPYNLTPLPLPAPVLNLEGARLPASYANFLIINDAVLLPFYAVEQDEDVKRIMSELFPDREIVGIDSRPLIEQFGSLHCCTMQLPQGVLPEF